MLDNGSVLFLALFAQADDLHGMVGHEKVVFLCHLLLLVLYGLIEELDDLAAGRTDKVVMVFLQPQFYFFPCVPKEMELAIPSFSSSVRVR